jgi:photosystem II stability/assembly factor-like uncharacterized protein
MRSVFRLWSVAAAGLLLAGCGKGGVKVNVPPLSAIVLNVVTDTIAVDVPKQYSATALDLSSQPVSGVPFIWSSSDPSIFTVTSSGRVTGHSEGAARLFVEYGGVRDSADLLVLPAAGGWFAQTSNSSRQLNDVFFLANGRHGCVVGNSGEVLTTNDAGDTWNRWTSGTAFNLNAVWFVSDSTGWAVGANGTALKSTTGGRTWSLVTTGSSDNLADVCFTDALHGWIVGSTGVVLRTIDGGANWDKQYISGSNLNGVAFSGLSDGWTVGNGGVIYGTHDGGVSWYVVQPAVTANSLNAVVRLDEAHAYAVGALGVAPRTIAGADSTVWELRSAGAANTLQGASFVSTTQGWGAGSNGSGIVLMTTDGGLSWTAQTAPAGNMLRGIWFVDALRGWAVGDNGRILHTGGGGE